MIKRQWCVSDQGMADVAPVCVRPLPVAYQSHVQLTMAYDGSPSMYQLAELNCPAGTISLSDS